MSKRMGCEINECDEDYEGESESRGMKVSAKMSKECASERMQKSECERIQRIKDATRTKARGCTSTFDVDSTKVSTICFPMVPLRTLPVAYQHKIQFSSVR